MRSNDLYILGRNHQRTDNFLKMTKTRTVTFLMMIVSTCALVLSLSDAHPIDGSSPDSNATEIGSDQGSNSRLVITHVVKTIEFEVGLLEDDGTGDNATNETTPEYIETDIKLLNVDLLKELVDRAREENDSAEGEAVKKRDAGDASTEEARAEGREEEEGSGKAGEDSGLGESREGREKRETDDSKSEEEIEKINSSGDASDSESDETLDKREANVSKGDQEPLKREAEGTEGGENPEDK